MEAGPFGNHKMINDQEEAQIWRTCGKVYTEYGILKKWLTQMVNIPKLIDNSMNNCWVMFLLRFAIDELTFPQKCGEHLLRPHITSPYLFYSRLCSLKLCSCYSCQQIFILFCLKHSNQINSTTLPPKREYHLPQHFLQRFFILVFETLSKPIFTCQ